MSSLFRLKSSYVQLISSQTRKVKSQEKAETKVVKKKVVAKRRSMGGSNLTAKKTSAATAPLDPKVVSKYSQYFNFTCGAWNAQPHAVSR